MVAQQLIAATCSTIIPHRKGLRPRYSFLMQLPANVLRKTVEDGPKSLVSVPMWETWRSYWILAWDWPKPGGGGHLGKE